MTSLRDWLIRPPPPPRPIAVVLFVVFTFSFGARSAAPWFVSVPEFESLEHVVGRVTSVADSNACHFVATIEGYPAPIGYDCFGEKGGTYDLNYYFYAAVPPVVELWVDSPRWFFQHRQMWQVSVGGNVIVPYAESVQRAAAAKQLSPVLWVLPVGIAVSAAVRRWAPPALRQWGVRR